MKIDVIKSIVAICIAALISWWYYSMAENVNSQLPIAVVMGLEASLFGICSIGISIPEYPRSATMLRVLCCVVLVLLMILNLVYVYIGINVSFYVINGIISLLAILAANGILNSKQ